MKVLHVIPAVAPRYGGPSRAVFEMSRALSGCGVEVLIATTDADGPQRLTVEKGTPVNFQGTETIFFPITLSERFSYSPKLARWLRGNVRNFDAVHIHAVFSHPCLAAANACQRSAVPYVVRPLGSLDPWSMSQKPWRKRLLWRLGIRRMLRGVAAIHYTSAEERRLAESSLGLSNGVVIPLGIEVNDLNNAGGASTSGPTPGGVGNHHYILVLSRLHPKKNLEALIEAFTSLGGQTAYARWRLVIAGDGEPDYVGRLKRLAGVQGEDSRVVFTGWLSGEEKRSALKGAALLALPSYQENFGLCVTEALAYGVPVVVSRGVNLAAEIEEARAGWVTGLQASDIERTLREVLVDAVERERRGAAGLEFVADRLAWPKVAGELVTLYHSVASKSAATYPAVSEVSLTGQ